MKSLPLRNLVLTTFAALPTAAFTGCEAQVENSNQTMSIAPELARVVPEKKELIDIEESSLVEADKNWLRSLVGKNINYLKGNQYITIQDRINFLTEVKYQLNDLAAKLGLSSDNIEQLKKELRLRTLDEFQDGQTILKSWLIDLNQGSIREVKKDIQDFLKTRKNFDPSEQPRLIQPKIIDTSGGFA